MKAIRNIISASAALLALASCNFLDVEPTDKVSADALFSSEAGIEAFLANLYYQMPIEAFDFNPETTPSGYKQGFHYNDGDPNNNGRFAWVLTDDCISTQHQDCGTGNDYGWWDPAYSLNNDVNSFFASISGLKTVSDETKEQLLGQAWFIRGQLYFALARRYGGVPIIEEVGDMNDLESLKIPRRTEVETWDYVLKCFSEAATRLDEEGNGFHTKADKWSSLAYLSRAALHAASVGKYWDQATVSGPAVDAGFVGGFTQEDIDRYYRTCMDACEQIIKSGRFNLYCATPATPEEATENLIHMFQRPEDALCESIFVKGFTKKGRKFGSNQDSWGNPAQTSGAWPHPGRFNPSLEFVENFENYDNPGHSAKFTTYEGDRFDYDGYTASRNYYQFADPLEMFKGKDARLAAFTILPGSVWKKTRIVIQGGVITTSGECKMDVDGDIKAEYVGADGKIYYQFGANEQKFFSGFSTNAGNNTRTGFGFRKYLDPAYESSGSVWNESTTDWMDIRYAEILLNYAECFAETGLGDASLARQCLNATRRRAAHMTEIDPTLENILRERRAELCLENARTWDLVRRRQYHQIFDGYKRGSLTPVLDLRTGKYIFVREYVQKTDFMRYNEANYYRGIPGTSINGCVQNPLH